MGPVAHAQCPTVIRVPQDAATIDAAVAQVCAGTTAEIVVGAGTWGVEVDSAPGSQITIRGAGRELTLIVPSVAGGRIVANGRYEGNNSVRFEGVRIEGGSGDAFRTSVVDCDVVGSGCTLIDGGVCSNARFVSCDADSWSTLYNTPADGCEFVGCVEPCLIWESSQVLINCTFLRTVGSAVRCWGSNSSRVEQCVFDNTKGGAGRAIEFACGTAQAPTALSVVDSTFKGMSAGTGYGGAILVGNPSQSEPAPAAASHTTISGSTFEGCSAGEGGAVYAVLDQPVDIESCVFTGNSATGGGGALSWQFGGWYADWAVANSLFSGNSAVFGGAIAGRGWDGDLTLATCEFQGNIASDSGGAVSWDRLRLHATECDFVGNSALSWAGGATSCVSSRPSTFTGCSFVSNSAGNRGGACSTYYYSDTTFQNCTFVGNGSGEGSALDFHGISTAQLIACGFEGNIASPGGSTLHLRGTDNGDLDIIISDCSFNGSAAPAGTNLAVSGSQTAVVSSSTVCGHGLIPFAGAVTDAGGNCIVESCADGDGNGTPDACQVVSVPGDYATIQAAIDATPKGEFRTVSVAPGTYAGPIQFRGKSVLVRGAGAGATVLQGSGGTRSSVVRFNGGESSFAGLEALTVRGGPTGTPFPTNPSALVGGGVFGYESAAGIRNCIIEGNASGFGGGAYLWQCTGSITGTTIRQNSATADGGGLQIYGGQVSVVDSTVVENYANSRGGGLHLVSGQTSMTRVSVVDNDSNNVAGGVSWVPVGAPMLVLNDCTVIGNAAAIAEGGISSVDDGGGVKLSLLETRVCGNAPAPNVAGAFNADSLSEVCDCIADVTLDGVVNGVDLAGLLSAWGTDGGPTPRADCNRDGTVDGADLGIVLGGWGTCPE
jgi:hypothetical protein